LVNKFGKSLGFSKALEKSDRQGRNTCFPRWRLTNAFSKKLENHIAAIASHCMYYNFARIHQTLRVTPAMRAGIASHVWSIQEILSLLKQTVTRVR
jgi:hypothetical protein